MFPTLNQGGNNNVGNGGSVPPQDNGSQVNNPQGSDWNNENGKPGISYPANSGFYPGSNFQGQNPQYPGNSNGMQENNQQYPGNGINNGNLGNYPQNPNMMQGNTPQYPGTDLSNGNPNFNYPGNSNVMQYPAQGNGLDHINKRPGINYPTNPPALNQNNYDRYPGYNNWNNNNNRYPGNFQIRPNFNTQGQYPGQNWNNANGLQNNQNPNQIGVPGNQQTQGLSQNPLIQGQPIRYPPNTYQNYNPGLQNGGSFPPQVANGMNNQLPHDNLQDPNMQYPQLPNAVTTTVTPPVTSTTAAMKQCVQDCPSTSEYNPLCGNNNITYFNEGKFVCARKCGIDVIIVRHSACPAASAANATPGVYA
ncbi:unnamed protein product, partial [Brenthis ino]